jgi:hypothetical protein
VFWGRASPSERSFVERTEVLGEATEEGYELQIDVTAQLQWLKWLPSRTKGCTCCSSHGALVFRASYPLSVRCRVYRIQK